MVLDLFRYIVFILCIIYYIIQNQIFILCFIYYLIQEPNNIIIHCMYDLFLFIIYLILGSHI